MQSWPICGGKNLAPPPKQQELLLTGYLHARTHAHKQIYKHTGYVHIAGGSSFYFSFITQTWHKSVAFQEVWWLKAVWGYFSFLMWTTWISCIKLGLLVTCPEILKPEFVSIAIAIRKSCFRWRISNVYQRANSVTMRSHCVKGSEAGGWVRSWGDTTV